MYYQWENVGRDQCPEIINYTRLDQDDIVNFYYTHRGAPLQKPLPEITFLVNTLEGLYQQDSLWAGLPYMVFSPKLREALIGAGVTNIEYYPVKIKNRETGEIISDYKIANIVGLIACMDKEHSVYVPDPKIPDRMKNITRLVLDISKIQEGHLLFRLAERRTIVLCHQSVRDMLLSKGITGVRFIEVESGKTDLCSLP